MILEPSGNTPVYKLVYSGHSGLTEREITLLEKLDTDEDQYLQAYCFLRGSKRTFETCNIISLTHLTDGQSFISKDFKFQFKPIVRIVKKTVSKSGNVYYYEKHGIDTKRYSPTWGKLGKQMFNHYIEHHKRDAVKIELDNNNEVCYLEWHQEPDWHRKSQKAFSSKINKQPMGCTSVLIGLCIIFWIVVKYLL